MVRKLSSQFSINRPPGRHDASTIPQAASRFATHTKPQEPAADIDEKLVSTNGPKRSDRQAGIALMVADECFPFKRRFLVVF
ncbi:hypothetical protein ACC679_36395 [Rhizobium ruizarguesonis]